MTKLLYPIGLSPKTNQLTIQLYISGFRNHLFRFELMKIHQHPPPPTMLFWVARAQALILRMGRSFTAPSIAI